MRSLPLILTTIVIAAPAAAAVVGWLDPDKVKGGGAFIATFYEDSYQPVSNETAFSVACEKDGTVTVDLHIGPRSNSYDVDEKTIVAVKFDDQEAFEMTTRSLGGKRLLDLLRSSKTLYMNVPGYSSSLEFDLRGATKALKPFSAQCKL